MQFLLFPGGIKVKQKLEMLLSSFLIGLKGLRTVISLQVTGYDIINVCYQI